MFQIALSVSCFFLFCQSALCDDLNAASWSIQPVGLRIVAEVPKQNGFPRPFNWSAGTTLVLHMSPSSGYILGYDLRQCSINEFTDDLGNELRDPNATHIASKSKLRANDYSDDHKHALVEVFGGKLPKEAARKIILRGKVAIIVAGTQKIHTIENVPMKQGTGIAVGDSTLTIKEIRQSNNNRPGVTLVIPTNGQIGDIRFFDANDQDLEARQVSWVIPHSERFNTRSDNEWRFSKQPPKIVRVEVEQWLDTKTVIVPINIETSVGLRPVK